MLDARAARSIDRRRRQYQEVDVGCRMQLRAAIAADRDQRPGAPRGTELCPPHLAQHGINERGARVNENLDGLFGKETRLQIIVGLAQEIAKRCGSTFGRGEQRRQSRKKRPWSAASGARMRVLDEIHVNGCHRGGSVAARAPSVRTSKPVSVISTCAPIARRGNGPW